MIKSNSEISSGEILFVKCVKDGIPNRDPLRDSDARRLFGEDDGRISLSDVSIKRDVRDFVLAKYPEGTEQRNDRFVFVQKKYSADGKSLLGRDGLAQEILDSTSSAETTAKGAKKKKGEDDERSEQERLMEAAFDVRIFGAVFSVKGKSFNQTGPVQFAWAHSMHPVETRYTQGTVVMPSKEAPIPTDKEADNDDVEEKGKTQGTIWTQYHLPFAIFAMPGVINSTIAKQTGMTVEDQNLLLEGLWKGTSNRQARGRGIQHPLFLCHVEYSDPFFRIGFLEELVELEAEDGTTFSMDTVPSRLSDVRLNVGRLAERLEQFSDKIASVNIWVSPSLKLTGKGVTGAKIGAFTIQQGVPEESA